MNEGTILWVLSVASQLFCCGPRLPKIRNPKSDFKFFLDSKIFSYLLPEVKAQNSLRNLSFYNEVQNGSNINVVELTY